MNPKIVFTGITSFRNHGVEALVVSSLAQLRARVAGASFCVLDREPEFDASRIPAPDVRFARDHTIRRLYSSRLRGTLTRLVPALDRYAESAREEIASASLVIASGGDVFCSEYGWRSLLTHLEPLKIALKHQVPFIIHAQSVGPFKSRQDADAFLQVARQAAAITVRERISYDYLLNALKLPPGLVTHTADPAFLLPRPNDFTLERFREYFRMDEGRPTVALSTSQAICNWLNSDYEQHFTTWCRVIEMLLGELDANLILIPHVQEIAVKNDDRILATELMRHFQHDPRLQLAGGDYTASEYKGIISQCDLVVAERMHAAIAGLSSAVCTVPIGYSVKAEGILTDLFDRDLVRDTLLIPLKDFLKPETACERIGRAWERRHEIKSTLEDRLPEVKRRAGLSFDIIAAALPKQELKPAAWADLAQAPRPA